MKWELITLGFSWGILLFKLYQQYRQCKNMYHNEQILTEQDKQKSQKFCFDSQKKIIQETSQQKAQDNLPDSANQPPKIEGKSQLQQQPPKKQQSSFQTNIDQCDFVVFPELYPHLRKKKSLIRKLTLDRSSNQRTRLVAKRKRDTKKYKEWFITNKVLTQIQESGQLTSQQIEQNYAKITKEIKSTCIEPQKSISESSKSQQGTDLGNGSIVIKKIQNKKDTQDDKVLEFLEQEDPFEMNSSKVVKYDPFN